MARGTSSTTTAVRRRRRLPSLDEAELIVGRRTAFTLAEVAGFFRVSLRTVDRWSRGEGSVSIRAVKIGRVVRVDAREVAYLMLHGNDG